MSDCGVCISSDYSACEGMIDEVEIVVSDAEHKCSECRKMVPAGSKIERADWYDDGWNYDEDRETDERDKKEPIWTCLVCAEIATAFYCGGDGRIYGGEFWEVMSDSDAFANLNASCFDRLTTPAAKAELQRRWMKWKGLPA
jgi:hypothetical protein